MASVITTEQNTTTTMIVTTTTVTAATTTTTTTYRITRTLPRHYHHHSQSPLSRIGTTAAFSTATKMRSMTWPFSQCDCHHYRHCHHAVTHNCAEHTMIDHRQHYHRHHYCQLLACVSSPTPKPTPTLSTQALLSTMPSPRTKM
jgi:hypothetical protein